VDGAALDAEVDAIDGGESLELAGEIPGLEDEVITHGMDPLPGTEKRAETTSASLQSNTLSWL
jgi:hypothetical protein